MIVNISEAKTHLSKLVELAYHGEKIVIAKNNTPLVDLVPHKVAEKRKLGARKGQIEIPEDFDAPSKEIEAMFYGETS